MDVNQFQKDLNELINKAMKSNVPLEFVAAKLDMVSFEIKFRYMMQLSSLPSQPAQISNPKIVIEHGGKN